MPQCYELCSQTVIHFPFSLHALINSSPSHASRATTLWCVLVCVLDAVKKSTMVMVCTLADCLCLKSARCWRAVHWHCWTCRGFLICTRLAHRLCFDWLGLLIYLLLISFHWVSNILAGYRCSDGCALCLVQAEVRLILHDVSNFSEHCAGLHRLGQVRMNSLFGFLGFS